MIDKGFQYSSQSNFDEVFFDNLEFDQNFFFPDNNLIFSLWLLGF